MKHKLSKETTDAVLQKLGFKKGKAGGHMRSFSGGGGRGRDMVQKQIRKMRREGRALLEDALVHIPSLPPEFIPRLETIAGSKIPPYKTLLKAIDEVPFEAMISKARMAFSTLSILPDSELSVFCKTALTKALKTASGKRLRTLAPGKTRKPKKSRRRA